MDPRTLLLAGGGGLLGGGLSAIEANQNRIQTGRQRAKDLALKAELMRYSPWIGTGPSQSIQPTQEVNVNPWLAAGKGFIGGGTSGAILGQGLQDNSPQYVNTGIDPNSYSMGSFWNRPPGA